MVDAPRSRFKVLIVADDADFVATAKTALESRVDVTHCASAAAARKLLETAHFHVVCADGKTGQASGVSFLRDALPKRQSTSLLLVTDASALSPADWRELPNEIHVLRKPFDGEKLVAMVIRLAEVSWAEESIRSLDSGSGGSKPKRP